MADKPKKSTGISGPIKFPPNFKWVILDFGSSYSKPFSKPINTKKVNNFLNFDLEKKTVDILYDEWYHSTIVANAGKNFFPKLSIFHTYEMYF